MKKRLILLMVTILILSGCGKTISAELPEKGGFLEDVENSKRAKAEHMTNSLISQANIKYIDDSQYSTEKECYDVGELISTSDATSKEITSGRICIDNNEFIAFDVEVSGYVCNGVADSIVCEVFND